MTVTAAMSACSVTAKGTFPKDGTQNMFACHLVGKPGIKVKLQFLSEAQFFSHQFFIVDFVSVAEMPADSEFSMSPDTS